MQLVNQASRFSLCRSNQSPQLLGQFLFMSRRSFEMNIQNDIVRTHAFTSAQACVRELSRTVSSTFNCRKPSSKVGYSTGAAPSATFA